jgi:TolB-like protein/Flp pilus assembly protein TadD
MKRCPECRRDYYDDSLLYCLDDGSALLEGPGSGTEPATAILHSTDASGDTPTRVIDPQTTAPPISPTDSESPANGLIRPKTIGWVVGALTVVIVLASIFGYRYYSSATATQIKSIAVLPFENRSGSSDTDYLSDGLADSLIYRLSQLPDLKVSPTSSVIRYKGSTADVSQVARELGVDAVLSGRLMQLGDDLNISVQLIDARTSTLIWAEQYDRKMSDLLATQREIATTIADKLQLKLVGDQAKGITKKYTNSNESYQLYMRGRHHFSKRTKTDMLQAIEYYRKATEIDPSFALAYARIAEVYGNLPAYAYISPREVVPLGNAAVQKALEIDPTLAEAHTFRGFLLAAYEWDWNEAERNFKRALELDPNSADAHLRYGQLFLGPNGRLDEALAEMKTAYDLEPLDIVTGGLYAWTYIFAGQKEKALETARKTYDLEPAHPFARYLMAVSYNANGLHAEAVTICESALRSDPDDQYMLMQVGLAYALSEQTAKAEEVITRLKALEKVGYVGPYMVATVYTALGKRDAAFSELEKAYKAHDFFLSRLKVDPFMDPLRDEPRYKGLLKRMNLPE